MRDKLKREFLGFTILFFLTLIPIYILYTHSSTPEEVVCPEVEEIHVVEPDHREKLISFILYKNHRVYRQLAEIIVDSAIEAEQMYGIDARATVMLIGVESSFRPDIVSSAGARGLMQVMPTVWFDDETNKFSLKVHNIIQYRDDLFDPHKNIMSGTFILRHYFDQSKKDNKLEEALTRYFGGRKNDHYDKFMTMLGEYFVYTLHKKALGVERDAS
jgi:hypothetical protein